MSKVRKWMMKEEKETTSSGSGDVTSSSGFKLFGRTIALSGGAECVSVSTKAASEEVDGLCEQLEGDNPGSVHDESRGRGGSVSNVGGTGEDSAKVEAGSGGAGGQQQQEVNPLSSSSSPQAEKPQRALTQEEKKEQCMKKPDKLIPCPRCESVDTKFCYYNNYNINQPRHFCKSCQRYWTAGGTLRNVLVGAGRRKNKYGGGGGGGSAQAKAHDSENLALTAVRLDHHEPAQQSALNASFMSAYASTVTLGTVPPMNLPSHAASLHCVSDSHCASSTVTSAAASQPFPGFSSMSAFKPTNAETSSDSVTKLRQRTRPADSSTDPKPDCASSEPTTSSTTYVLTPRAPPAPHPSDAQAVWTKTAAPLGFFNGAWPYGYNIGWSSAGPIPGVPATSSTPPSLWAGMWTSNLAQPALSAVPPFGWNMLPGGWALPLRPVPAVGVQMQSQPQTPSRKRDSAASDDGRAKLARVSSTQEEVAA